MTASVRPADPADAPTLAALTVSVAAEPEEWLLEAGGRSPDDERRYLRFVRADPDTAVLVAEERGEVVGRLSLSRDPHPASAHVADLGLVVAAGHRRCGIGSALLVAAEAWAREAGVTKLELHVLPHNAPAIGLYEKLGYECEGVRRAQYRRAAGDYVDAILMAKLLGRAAEA